MRKPFFVGIGAQKAGTTWLTRYLQRHTQVGFSLFKELHYFDCKYRPDLCAGFDSNYLVNLKDHVAKVGDQPTPHAARTIRCLSLILEMKWDARRYADYFDLIAEDHHRIVGEITPSYAWLNEDGFHAIRALAPDAKFVFLLRDPVDRYWSLLRFQETRFRADGFVAAAELEPRLSDPQYVIGSDYKRTFSELYKVANREDVCVLFYEDLLNPQTTARELTRLTEFLGIDYMAGDPENKVNASMEMEMDPRMLPGIVRTFADVYEHVAEHYADNLPARWRERMALL